MCPQNKNVLFFCATIDCNSTERGDRYLEKKFSSCTSWQDRIIQRRFRVFHKEKIIRQRVKCLNCYNTWSSPNFDNNHLIHFTTKRTAKLNSHDEIYRKGNRQVRRRGVLAVFPKSGISKYGKAAHKYYSPSGSRWTLNSYPVRIRVT